MSERQRVIVVLCVGMTKRLLPLAPTMAKLAQQGWSRSFVEILPAVTCTAQATLLTGRLPAEHGIVANGWLYRDTMEVRFWQQSNRLIQCEPLYVTAKRRAQRRGWDFRCAKLFWWFNQGADVAYSITPKPYYGADGNKIFGITGRPADLPLSAEAKLGRFPFETFWGPLAGYPCTEWIARCTSWILEQYRPDLTLVYLPHLDYDLLRYGPGRTNLAKLVAEIDQAFRIIWDTAMQEGAQVVVVSEYGHLDVSRPIYINRYLREQGYLVVRPGPFGEQLETFESQAFAVCDHQICHIYVREAHLIPRIRDQVATLPGIAKTYIGEEREEIGLCHERSGEIIALSQPDAWFAYPFWLDNRCAPDYARTVDIHRKPGFDPCELFFDPQLWWPRGRMIWRFIQKKLGFRVLLDIVPLDATIVGGSHGLVAQDPLDRPIFIGVGAAPPEPCPMTYFRDWLLSLLDLAEE
ncbi:MAG: alkaline phosphatase family protein [Gemmatales bacterium]|nr:alkaline phosphatase family protein [Gemmatales bacterium]MDW7995159.1 alkaline phosphatase family protein [Gemmatales bacterium]